MDMSTGMLILVIALWAVCLINVVVDLIRDRTYRELNEAKDATIKDLQDRLAARTYIEYKQGQAIPSAVERIRMLETENDLARYAATITGNEPDIDQDQIDPEEDGGIPVR